MSEKGTEILGAKETIRGAGCQPKPLQIVGVPGWASFGGTVGVGLSSGFGSSKVRSVLMETTPPATPRPRPIGRRRSRRFPADFPVTTIVGERRRKVLATDISMGGLGVRSETRYPIRTHVRLSFEIGGGGGERAEAPITFEALTVRCEPRPREDGFWNVAFYFTRIDTRSRERLLHYIQAKRDL